MSERIEIDNPLDKIESLHQEREAEAAKEEAQQKQAQEIAQAWDEAHAEKAVREHQEKQAAKQLNVWAFPPINQKLSKHEKVATPEEAAEVIKRTQDRLSKYEKQNPSKRAPEDQATDWQGAGVYTEQLSVADVIAQNTAANPARYNSSLGMQRSRQLQEHGSDDLADLAAAIAAIEDARKHGQDTLAEDLSAKLAEGKAAEEARIIAKFQEQEDDAQLDRSKVEPRYLDILDKLDGKADKASPTQAEPEADPVVEPEKPQQPQQPDEPQPEAEASHVVEPEPTPASDTPELAPDEASVANDELAVLGEMIADAKAGNLFNATPEDIAKKLKDSLLIYPSHSDNGTEYIYEYSAFNDKKGKDEFVRLDPELGRSLQEFMEANLTEVAVIPPEAEPDTEIVVAQPHDEADDTEDSASEEHQDDDGDDIEDEEYDTKEEYKLATLLETYEDLLGKTSGAAISRRARIFAEIGYLRHQLGDRGDEIAARSAQYVQRENELGSLAGSPRLREVTTDTEPETTEVEPSTDEQHEVETPKKRLAPKLAKAALRHLGRSSQALAMQYAPQRTDTVRQHREAQDNSDDSSAE